MAQPPVARFVCTSTAHLANFDASASTADGSIVSYHWDFNQSVGTFTSSTVAEYTYGQAGVYTVGLTVVDDQGAIGATSAVITIADTPEPITEQSGDLGLDGLSEADASITPYLFDETDFISYSPDDFPHGAAYFDPEGPTA